MSTDVSGKSGEPSPPGPARHPAAAAQKFDLSKIRHELRTPINHIIGYSEMLQEEEDLPEGLLSDLRKIHSGGRQLLSLINSYFDDETFSTRRDLRQVYHELRTPVNQIIGYSEILQEDAIALDRNDLRPDLQKIHTAALHWLALMEAHLIPPNISDPVSTSGAFPAGAATSPSLNAGVGFRRPDSTKTAREGVGSRILVVDDDEANREMLARRLQRHGYEVTIAENGLQALQLVREQRFDLVLLDMIMPGLDGYQVLAKIKADHSVQDIPVIMISALDQVEGIARCIENGAEDYVAKPFNPVFLHARIGAALEKKRLRDREQIHLTMIEGERAKADRLLLNVLPRVIADRLKNGETIIVDSFADVTVLFADLVGFTALARHIEPGEMVRLLNEVFSVFDVLSAKHGLEKIKTIGDAYMAAAGLPLPRPDHAKAAAELALAMQAALAHFNGEYDTSLQMRIGLNSGPVVAGIIGRDKFSYDLWGDTVNTASRMESHGITGRIQVSGITYEVLKSEFRFEKRDSIEVKGKGQMDVYLLEGSVGEH